MADENDYERVLNALRERRVVHVPLGALGQVPQALEIKVQRPKQLMQTLEAGGEVRVAQVTDDATGDPRRPSGKLCLEVSAAT